MAYPRSQSGATAGWSRSVITFLPESRSGQGAALPAPKLLRWILQDVSADDECLQPGNTNSRQVTFRSQVGGGEIRLKNVKLEARSEPAGVP